MTELRKAVRRSVVGLLREELVVTLYPHGVIGMRAKRTRREYTVPLVSVYKLAIEHHLAEQRQARQVRKVKRGVLALREGR